MIPAIKESNQLKQFLGIKEHFPEFYNDSLDQAKASEKYYSLNLKDFTIEKPEKAKGELTKFITRPKDTAASYATVVEESKSSLDHSKGSKSKTNLRYQVQKDHELDISPELRAPPQMYQEQPAKLKEKLDDSITDLPRQERLSVKQQSATNRMDCDVAPLARESNLPRMSQRTLMQEPSSNEPKILREDRTQSSMSSSAHSNPVTGRTSNARYDVAGLSSHGVRI